MEKGWDSMENLEIVACQTNDLATLKRVGIETFNDTFAAQNTVENMQEYLERAYADEKLSAELKNKDSFFYFLKKEEEILGYIKMNINQAQTEKIAENSLEVERIYIRKAHLRKGFGKLLLQFAQEQANNWGKMTVWLGVWEYNFNAQSFYKKMGFKRVGEHTFLMGDDEQTDFILLKNIG